MEVLQKLTLYDLLGYALPGCVLLVFLYADSPEDLAAMEVGGVLLFIAFGYLIGIMISELMRWVELLIGKLGGKKQWSLICSQYSLTRERMERALKKAHIIEPADSCGDMASLSDYSTAIYADIQTDTKYLRVHNYASLALLCKNMFCVSLACMVDGLLKQSYGEGLFGAVGLFCFGVRWQRIGMRQTGYAICWFLEKYDGN